jgi:NAD(P)-dependent dehydrogenase (short-subunit alcohol dehydrogenase family)
MAHNALPDGLKDFALDGKAALIIGAEHPVGRVAAITLAEAGAQLLLTSQNPGTEKKLKEVAGAVAEAGGNASIQVQTAAVRADVRATIDLAVKELGGLDILVTAIDGPFYGPAEAADDSDYDRVMEDNFKTLWVACQEVGRVMIERGGGVIVNLSTVMAERGVPNAALYCAAKGAVRNLCRSLALEWARSNIRINLIECGWMDEPDSPAAVPSDFSSKLIKYLPYRRLLKPEEIAGALLYLVSPAAGFVTGEAIAIDGGLLCRV